MTPKELEARIKHDMMMYGCAFVTKDGQIIPPQDVMIVSRDKLPGSKPMPEGSRFYLVGSGTVKTKMDLEMRVLEGSFYDDSHAGLFGDGRMRREAMDKLLQQAAAKLTLRPIKPDNKVARERAQRILGPRKGRWS